MVPNKLKLSVYYLCLSSLFFTFICEANSNKTRESLPTEVKQFLLTANFQAARPLLSALAQQGNSLAQYQLALFYLQGNSVEESPQQAEKLLRLAAKTNNKASYLLGSLYAQGKKVNRNLSTAKKFLAMSKNSGNRQAKALYDKLFSASSGAYTSKELQQKLITSIKQNKHSEIRKLFNQGARLNTVDNQGNTPLTIALNNKNKQEDIALWIIKTRRLQSSTEHFNQQNNEGNSPLHLAAKNNYPQVASLLIDIKANTNTVNQQKQTPLMLAIIAQNQHIAQQLINQDALLNIKDIYGKIALDYAKKSHMHLVIKSPTKNKENIQENKRLSRQALAQKRQVLQLQSKDKISPYYAWPILSIAVAQNQPQLIAELVKEKNHLWQVNPQYDSAISIAIKQDQSDLAIRLLNASNKNINTLTNSDKEHLETLFRVAIKKNDLNVIDKLLSFTNKKVVANTPIEKTPLWYAIEYNKPDIFKRIIKVIPPTNRQDIHHRSYLLQASKLNLFQLSSLLIHSGLNVNLTDEKGRNALWYAADLANSKLVIALIKAKSNIDQADSEGYTPLMRSVICDCFSCILPLLNAKADPQKKTINANTSLLFSAQSKPEILSLILNFNYQGKGMDKLDIKQRNSNNLTPLMLAVMDNCQQCVQLLLQAGANPKRKNDNRENSFDLAKGYPEILTTLTKF